MKRTLLMLLSLAVVVVSAGTAEAHRNGRVERTVQGSYSAYPTPVTGCNAVLGPWACFIVRTLPKERFLTAEVADAHGQPVLVNVYSQGRHLGSFCNRTSQRLAFSPGATLEFDVGQGRADFNLLPCPERVVKTVGTITVTLSDQP